MIQLATRVWQMELQCAIPQLQKRGIRFPFERMTPSSQEISEYIAQHVERRRRYQQLAECPQLDFVMDNGAFIDLAHQIGLPISCGSRVRRMGSFVTTTTCLEINRRVRPHVLSQAAATTGGGRVLHGRGWRELLAVPFSDLPGRVCGYLLVGRNGTADDIRYHSATACQSITRAGKCYPAIEGGLAMLGVLLDKTKRLDDFGNVAFVFGDPFEALRLQARHLMDHENPLPIVGAIDTLLQPNNQGVVRKVSTNNILQAAPKAQPIFCSYTPERRLFERAAKVSGRVWIGTPPTMPYTVHNWLLDVEQAAKPWTVALEDVIRESSAEFLQEFLHNLEIPDEQLRDFLRKCQEPTRARVRSVARFRRLLETAKANGHTITESDEGWISEKTGVCISSAVLRVEKIHVRADGDKPQYEGHILERGKRVPFLAPMDLVENRTFAWMRRTLAKAGITTMESRPRFSQDAVQIAHQFCKPEIIHNAGRFGLDSRRGFVFPGFMIAGGGRIREESSPMFGGLAPGAALLPPEHLGDEVFESMTQDTPTNRIFWAVAACIAANVIDRPSRLNKTPIGLCGEGAREVGTFVAKAFGCVDYQVRSRLDGPIELMDRIDAAVSRHNWPLKLQVSPRIPVKKLLVWAYNSQAKNVILNVDRFVDEYKDAIQDWRVVRWDKPAEVSDHILQYGPLILPAWLQDLSGRRLQLDSRRKGDQPLRALDDFTAWIGARGNLRVVRKAVSLLIPAVARDL